jgi:hypothetical protein
MLICKNVKLKPGAARQQTQMTGKKILIDLIKILQINNNVFLIKSKRRFFHVEKFGPSYL